MAWFKEVLMEGFTFLFTEECDSNRTHTDGGGSNSGQIFHGVSSAPGSAD
jgi:hypothetical protein